jgi:hypothetical protein
MVEIPNGSSESVVGVVVVAVEGGVEMVCIGDGNPKVEEEVCSVSQASTKPSISNVVTKLRAPCGGCHPSILEGTGKKEEEE